MTQRQLTNHKNNNLLVLVGDMRVLPETILKFRHLKYRSRKKNIVAYQKEGRGLSASQPGLATASSGRTVSRKKKHVGVGLQASVVELCFRR